MLLRVRVTSFLSGFGLASALAFWQLRSDITTSSEYLAAQAQEARDTLERRVSALEAFVLPPQQRAAAAPQQLAGAVMEVVEAAADAPAVAE